MLEASPVNFALDSVLESLPGVIGPLPGSSLRAMCGDEFIRKSELSTPDVEDELRAEIERGIQGSSILVCRNGFDIRLVQYCPASLGIDALLYIGGESGGEGSNPMEMLGII